MQGMSQMDVSLCEKRQWKQREIGMVKGRKDYVRKIRNSPEGEKSDV
jgi:hypothetical protein